MITRRSILTAGILMGVLLACLAWSSAAAGIANGEEKASVLYVKPGAAGNCASWGTACDLQVALTQALAGDQIWVAAGTYRPTSGGDRTINFVLKSGVAIYGGFPPSGGDWASRDWTANQTILSGDIGVSGDAADNTYQIVYAFRKNNVVLDGFTISGGNANGAYPNNRAGGMYCNECAVALAHITFSNNYAAQRGGGMFAYNVGATLTLSDVTFSANTAGEMGGGLSISGGDPVLDQVLFTGNAAYDGGGLHNSYSNPGMTDVTFTGNTATRFGGGLHNTYSHPSITRATFTNNTTQEDGGGLHNTDSSPIMQQVTFTGNHAAERGGGMYSTGGGPLMTDMTFTNNTAGLYAGGYYNNSATSTLTNVVFTGNTAQYGGGMVSSEKANPTLTDVAFNNNIATEDGGGMFLVDSGDPILTNVTFSGNSAQDRGGGMYNSSSLLDFTNVAFINNTAGINGGGVYNSYSTGVFRDITFSGNSAALFAGGMMNNESSPTLINVTISGNTAGDRGGGMFNLYNSNPSLTNVTIYGNTASGLGGGGIYNHEGCVATLTNAIVWGNTPNSIMEYATSNVTYSAIQGGYAGIGNINQDPQLGALADNGGDTQTHALPSGSPAIDRGDPYTCQTADQRGMPRPVDGNGDGWAGCDMGAYENQETPILPYKNYLPQITR